MPRNNKKNAGTANANAARPKVKNAAKPRQEKTRNPKIKKSGKASKALEAPAIEGKEKLLSSVVVFEGRLFRVLRDRLIEPGGGKNERDVIRHNGSVVILAIDRSKSKKNPWVVVERQYRHAARQFLWELPAGKLEKGEDPLAGAKRELAEETGYRAKKWKLLTEFYPSPGFLGESMQIFLAEGLKAGPTNLEDDEHIELRLVKLSEVLKMIDKGAILDGKTLTGVLMYARQVGGKGKK
jgi:ADP-ribose pyrophosphatase